jgi:hypothetical protein
MDFDMFVEENRGGMDILMAGYPNFINPKSVTLMNVQILKKRVRYVQSKIL